MRELRLTAVSEDCEYLILSDGDEQFALRADERLHAAIRGDRARLGQLEIQLESQLRPRDIQARIRSGESVESVAAAATMPLEKVRRFAGPVLAEREHIAGRARQANLRRPSGEGPVRTLETAAVDYAASVGAQPEDVEWDAWRAEDGRWRVQCSWGTSPESAETEDAEPTAAVFSFDPTGRSVVPQDVTARMVSGEPRPEPEPVPEQEPPAGPPRLSVVTQPPPEPDTEEAAPVIDEPMAAEPIAALVRQADPGDELPEPPEGTGDGDDHQSGDSPAEAARRPRRTGRYGRPDRRRREPELWSDHPRDEQDEASTDRLRLSDIASHVEDVGESDDHHQPELAPTAQEAPPAAKPRGSSRSRRPTVPTWDEIMFGRRKND